MKTGQVRVLHIEDCEDDFILVRAKLRRIARDIDFVYAESGEQALSILERERFDCILCDYQMPGMTGLTFLKALRHKGDSTPVIMVTGQGSEETAAEALRSGANDYFQKKVGFVQTERLLNSIQRAVRESRLEISKRQTEDELRFHSRFDELITSIFLSLIAAPSDKLSAEIDKVLRKIGEFFSADRTYIYTIPGDGGVLECAYEWCADGVQSWLGKSLDLKMEDFTWWLERLSKGSIIRFASLDEIPDEEGTGKEIFEKWGLKSAAGVPLISSGALIGYLGFGSFRDEKNWAPARTTPMKVLGEVITAAFERKREDAERIRRSRLSETRTFILELILQNVPIPEFSSKLLDCAKELTESHYGFVGYFDEFSRELICPTLTFDVWNICKVPDKDIVFRDIKGLRGWVLENQRPLLLNNVADDPRYLGVPEGHIPIDRFLCAPAVLGSENVGIVALANPPKNYDDSDLEVVNCLAGLFAEYIKFRRTSENLTSAQHALEMVVDQRTVEIKAANEALKAEINDRILAERALRESERKFRTIFETSKDAIFISTKEGRILDINQSGVDLFGYSKEELLSMSAEKLYADPQDRKRYVETAENLDFTPNFPVKYKRKDGKIVYALTSSRVRRDENGNVIGYEGIIHDITERKLAEDALRASEERFRTLFDESPVSLWEESFSKVKQHLNGLRESGVENLDEYFRQNPDELWRCIGLVEVISVNRATLELYGAGSVEELKANLHFVICEDAFASVLETLKAIDEDRERFEIETFNRTLGGEKIAVELRWALPKSEEEPFSMVMVCITDVTDRKRAELEILDSRDRLAEQAKMLEEAGGDLEAFSHSLSHDLKAPVRHLLNFAQLIHEEYAPAAESGIGEYLEAMQSAGERLEGFLDDLLKLSKASRVEMERTEVDLTSMAKKIAAWLSKSEPGRNVSFSIEEGLVAQGDEGLLRIALENLLGNAWKFTSKQDKPLIEFGKKEGDDKAVFYVRDNGIGFSMAYAHRLFIPFQRLHDGREFDGEGIGLATVKRIISRHGGKVWAEAEPKSGAVFYFTLE